MFNAINLLGSILQQRSAPSAGQRLGAAFGQGGSLGGLLSQFGGGAGGGAMGSLMSALGGRGRDPDADQRQSSRWLRIPCTLSGTLATTASR